jgi:hypothetical protein
MELDDKFIETLQTIKGIAESIRRNGMEKNNSKVQEQLKDLLGGFKQELEKGNTARTELSNKLNEVKEVDTVKDMSIKNNVPEEKVLEKLNELKEKAVKLAKDNNIEWAICKEYQPKHHRDSIKSTLDDLLKNAKEKAEQQNRERSQRTKSEPKKEKAPSRG